MDQGVDAVVDSPFEWVKNHIDRYVATDGVDGHLWRGAPTLLLTMTGRRSGQQRRTALIYAKHGDDFVVVASKGGAADHPLWYLNLVTNPDVELQVGARRFAAVARTATPEEKRRLWPLMVAVWPAYEEYRAKTDRNIPLVLLSPLIT